jgi:hypothetical protein
MKYRDKLCCYAGWYGGRLPGLNDPIHCSNNDSATDSCYNVGEKDGMDLSYQYINTCSENHIPLKPPGIYSKKYLKGRKNGIEDATGAASNDDDTYCMWIVILLI